MDLFLSIATWVLIVVSANALLRALSDRFLMRAVYGRGRYDEMQTVTSLLGFQSRRVLTLRAFKWLGLWVGFAALAHHFQHAERPWAEMGRLWAPMIALMVGCVQVFGQQRPAAILVLGGSTRDAILLQGAISNTVRFHRSVSLLETSDLLADMRHVSGDVFRITLGGWREAVWRFARSALVLVVDVRQTTDLVEEELRFVVAEGLQYKTLLLDPGNVSRSRPELAACRVASSTPECVAVVARAFDGHDTLPSDVKPLRDLNVTGR